MGSETRSKLEISEIKAEYMEDLHKGRKGDKRTYKISTSSRMQEKRNKGMDHHKPSISDYFSQKSEKGKKEQGNFKTTKTAQIMCRIYRGK